MSAQDRLDAITARGDGEVRERVASALEREFGPVNVPALSDRRDHWLRAADAVLAHARQDVPALAAALRAVLDLHKQVHGDGGFTVCEECHEVGHNGCPTVRAIDAALGGDQ